MKFALKNLWLKSPVMNTSFRVKLPHVSTVVSLGKVSAFEYAMVLWRLGPVMDGV